MRSRNRSGRVRIIGGRWRGRRIAFPDIAGVRPTPDRVRETLFNWLTPYLDGVRVLDLFAGSGILGFEALSRGASSVTAVENHRLVARRLRDSALDLDAVDFDILVTDSVAFLDAKGVRPFDLVFVDPPHTRVNYEALCLRLDTSGLLRPNAMVYVEFSTHRVPVFVAPDSWREYRSGHAGDLTYQLWQRT